MILGQGPAMAPDHPRPRRGALGTRMGVEWPKNIWEAHASRQDTGIGIGAREGHALSSLLVGRMVGLFKNGVITSMPCGFS